MSCLESLARDSFDIYNVFQGADDMKPIIGILPLFDEKKDSYWMLPGYMKGIMDAGGIPVMLPFIEDEEDIKQLSTEFDGYLFTGGPDIDPVLYHEEKNKECGELCPIRDKLESALFKAVYEADKPILGICRGLQFMNVMRGGILYQDLPSQYSSDTSHRMKPPYDSKVHKVKLVDETPLKEVLGVSLLPVNSCHHQAIKTIGEDLLPMAISTDGLVEAVYAPGKKFVWGVQWHPEFMYKELESKKIFKEFVEKCKE